MQQALALSGCQVVTVAVRRERLVDKQGRSLLDFLDLDKYIILPNTAGCFTAEDAIRVSLLGRELLEKQGNKGAGWVKLEVLGDKKTLLPDPVGTIEATRELVKEGFTVLAYRSDDPARRSASRKPAPPGHAGGLAHRLGPGRPQSAEYFPLSRTAQGRRSNLPVIVDAGVGTASDVAIAMELGADGVFSTPASPTRKIPVKMADAMKHALKAGMLAHQSGRIPKKRYATASSPFDGVISYIPGE